MSTLYEICHNIGSNIPENRIDGILIGNPDQWLENILERTEDGWIIYVVGDIIKKNDIFKKLSKENYEFYATIKKKNITLMLDILKQSYLEVLYILDAGNTPMFLIDDYPDDVTINLEFLK
ncbi:MAG: hypothetical protein B5M52_08050 [Helicobacteraceae bacterium 4484_230]|nr:MAG: hypothetical protein B5M52_08050 [Helicobacteraceae bacterium 4484_230]